MTEQLPKILCIGDSNTFGYDPTSYIGERFDDNTRWTGLLAQTGCTVQNAGVNGMTIEGANGPYLDTLFQDGSEYELIIVMLGTNDVCSGASAEEAAGRMERLLERLCTLAPQAQLLLIAPPPLRQDVWSSRESVISASMQLGDAFRALADRLGVPFADAAEWGVEIGADGVHFTEAGHSAFASGLIEFLGLPCG